MGRPEERGGGLFKVTGEKGEMQGSTTLKQDKLYIIDNCAHTLSHTVGASFANYEKSKIS